MQLKLIPMGGKITMGFKDCFEDKIVGIILAILI